MFCKNCGKYTPDGREKCIYCGGELSEKQTVQARHPGKDTDRDKTVVGVILSLLLGIIGLVIGLLIYPTGQERATFLSGWLKCFVVCIILSAVFVIAYSCIIFTLV